MGGCRFKVLAVGGGVVVLKRKWREGGGGLEKNGEDLHQTPKEKSLKGSGEETGPKLPKKNGKKLARAGTSGPGMQQISEVSHGQVCVLKKTNS